MLLGSGVSQLQTLGKQRPFLSIFNRSITLQDFLSKTKLIFHKTKIITEEIYANFLNEYTVVKILVKTLQLSIIAIAFIVTTSVIWYFTSHDPTPVTKENNFGVSALI